MLELQRTFIKKELWKHKLVVDVNTLVEKLYAEGKINEFMTTDTIYTITLINLSLQHPIYKRLLNKNYLYDLEFDLVTKNSNGEEIDSKHFDENRYDQLVENNISSQSSQIQELISDMLKPHVVYTFACYVGDRYYVMVKYKDIIDDYNGITNMLELKLKESQMIKQYEVKFNEKIIAVSNTDLGKKYEELIRHVRAIKLPLQVIDDECFGLSFTYRDIIDVTIQLEYSDKWPKDSHAVGYAKTAFYCEIYKRSKFRHYVDEACVVLKYKNVYFRLTIIEERKMNFVLKKNFYKSLESLTKTVPNIKNNILMVKKYLNSHGYYPFYFDDLMIDVICLSLERINCPSRFLKEFLNYNFEYKKLNVETLEVQESSVKRFCIYKKLDNLFIDLPDSSVIKRLKLLNKIQLKNDYDLLETNYYDFDFCLSYVPRKDFIQIDENGLISKFIDWEVLNRKEVKKNAYVYYSDHNKIVMIKGKGNTDIVGLFYYLLSTTSYKYYFKNK